jgi:hypothetical protein
LNKIAQRINLDEQAERHKDAKGRYTASYAKLKTQLNRKQWEIYDLRKRLKLDATKPQTVRGKTYRAGYDPEHPERSSQSEPSEATTDWRSSGGTAVKPRKRVKTKEETRPWQ